MPAIARPPDFAKLQRPDGSFAGDKWGEIDTRCVRPAVAARLCPANALHGRRSLHTLLRACRCSCRPSWERPALVAAAPYTRWRRHHNDAPPTPPPLTTTGHLRRCRCRCARDASARLRARACVCARRFSYCALLACSILGRLHALDVAAAVDFIAACRNFDGGFGCTPGEGRGGKEQGQAARWRLAWWMCLCR